MMQILPLALTALLWTNPFSLAREGRLGNGLRVVLLPDPSMPVVSSTVLVGAGSERESLPTSGATHLLEHLLFNGTSTMTQEQLYETMDLHGVYLNAATRERGTILVGLAPPDELATLLQLQAEMLFRSTIPEDKFEKEKQIVLEEMAKDRVHPDEGVSLHRARSLFEPSPCRLPILGLQETIEAMERAAVLEYYRRHYVPNNMTLILIGRFPWPHTWEILGGTFGTAVPAPAPTASPCPFAPARATLDTVRAPVSFPTAWFTYRGPAPSDEWFHAFFLASLRLPEALARSSRIRASWESSLHLGASESRLILSAAVGSREELRALLAAGPPLAEASEVTDADIRRSVTSWKAEALRWFERPHMLAVMAYDLLSWRGWDGLSDLWDRLERLDAASWRRHVVPSLQSPVSTVVVIPGPGELPLEEFEAPLTLSEEVWPDQLTGEEVPDLPVAGADFSAAHREVLDTLPSGLVIAVREESGLDLAGLHVLFVRKGSLEPVGREGVAELFHRLVGTGPACMSEEAFDARLAAWGALLQVTDDPRLPFDDYYYSPRWGYLRLTIPPDSLEAAAALLVEALRDPRLEEGVFERERAAARDALAREHRSPSKVGARRLWEHLIPGDVRSRSPLGEDAALSSLRADDVAAFAPRYVTGPNLIVSVCTPSRAEDCAASLRRVFSEIQRGDPLPPPPSPPPVPGPWRVEDSLGVGQGYLATGLLLPVSPGEEPTVEVLAALLDRRMGLELREGLGLAYSLGAGAVFGDGWGLVLASMSTRPHRLAEAEHRLVELIRGLASEGPRDSLEVRAAAMGLEQRTRLRNLTRVGRAFSIGMGLRDGRNPDGFFDYRAVTLEQVRAMSRKMTPERLVTVVVR